jgi:hypothetical protein
MAKTLTLTFKFDGTVEKKTAGFQGRSCAKETEWVEKALGVAGERKWTAEAGAGYVEADPQKQKVEGGY